MAFFYYYRFTRHNRRGSIFLSIIKLNIGTELIVISTILGSALTTIIGVLAGTSID